LHDKTLRQIRTRKTSTSATLLSQLDEQPDYVREVERHLVALIESIEGSPDERQLSELIRFSIELCDVIQHHIVEEEDQLLRLADARLSQEEQTSLAAKMKQLEPLICTTGAAVDAEPRAVNLRAK